VGVATARVNLCTLLAYANGLRVTSSFVIGGTSTILVGAEPWGRFCCGARMREGLAPALHSGFARGCSTSIAQPTSSDLPSHQGVAVCG
jgi:hypothetical protein